MSSLIPCFSVKSDQGSLRRPKGIAVYVNFSIPSSLVITQVKKKQLKITFSSISPYSYNISFSPSSLHFRPDFSLLLTFFRPFLPPPYCVPPPSVKAAKNHGNRLNHSCRKTRFNNITNAHVNRFQSVRTSVTYLVTCRNLA